MMVWVIEYDHGTDARGVEGVAFSLEAGLERVREGKSIVKWEEPKQAFIGGGWLLRGTWESGFFDKPQTVLYRFTEHRLLPQKERQ